MKTSRNWRAAIALTAAAATAFSLAGCAGTSAGGESGGDVTLTVQAWADATQADRYESTFAEFEKKNPGIKVKLDWMDLSAYFDKLNTKFAAGDAPDVFFLTGQWIGEYAGRGALLDYNKYTDDIDLSAIPKPQLAAGQLDGATYGIPTGLTTIGFVYNTDIVAQAGLEMPDDTTWTWDDFETFNKEIHDKTGVYGTGFYIPWAPMIGSFARQRGEDLYTPDGQLGLTEKTVEDYFQLTVDMRADGGYAPAGALETQATTTADSPLGKKVIASQTIPVNVFGDFNTALDGSLALVRLPGEVPTHGSQVTPTLLWAAASSSKHPEAAAKLVDFLTNDADSFTDRSTLLGVPVNPEVAEKVSAGLEGDQKTFVDYVQALLAEDLPTYHLEPAGAGDVANALVSVATEVEFGRMTPAEAAKKFIADAKAALAAAG